MDKGDVSEILEEIGLLLELKGENPFKIRAYTQAARAIDALSEDLLTLVREQRLGEIPGIGEALQEKISTLVLTGTLPYYKDLKASVPPGQLEMLEIPGLGPKKIIALYRELQVASVAELESACHDGRVAQLKGFGPKTVLNLLAGIEQRRLYAKQHRLSDALVRAEEIVDLLRSHPAVTRLSIAGSLRRAKEVIKDIDLIASSNDPKLLMDAFVSLPDIVRVTNHGETKSSVLLEGGLSCDLRVVSDREYASALLHFTGSKEHNVALRQRAIARGMKLSEWGLFRVTEDREEWISSSTEEDLYRALDLAPIPPELREDLGEIEAAANGEIPRLVEWTQLKGCFHNHTTESDGKNTLSEMIQAADDLGFEYLGIADHSQSSVQANGLSPERLLTQVAEIRRWNSTQPEVHVFAGSEVDILKSGELDFPDEILAQLDYVVASVHNAMSSDADEMTQRILRAMENPYVTMIGHLTGRLLLMREGYPLHHAAIIDCAAETGTWIELNANPRRLDMDWRWWRKARDRGVLCSINPDAHRTQQLEYVKIGATVARKGWLQPLDVVNTRHLSSMQTLLQAKRKKFGVS